MLDDEVPLMVLLVHLGQLCAAVEGQGSKSFDKKDFVLAIQKLTFYCKKLPIRLFYIYKKSKSRS
jgi:hypothetical protein